MVLSRYEQETVINFNEAESTADIYTHNKSLRQKLEMWALDRPTDCRLVRKSHDGKAAEYIVPKTWLRVKPPRAMSAAQKAALASAREKAKTSM